VNSIASTVFAATLPLVVVAAGCSHDIPARREIQSRVVDAPDPRVVEIDRPEQFARARAETREVNDTLDANGVVAPEVSRTVHVNAMAGGRLADVRVRLGDAVHEGDVLFVVQSADLGTAIADWRKALADQRLTDAALRRAKRLFAARALALKDLQQAANDADKARIDVDTGAERIRILGGDVERPAPLIEVRAPIDGIVVEQNAAGGEAVKSLDSSPNLLTVADLSRVWVLCDVYENDLGDVHVGDRAEVRLVAYRDRTFGGAVSDIGRVLDPTTRAAKVRVEIDNAEGLFRPGMFATARFVARTAETRTVTPASAVLRLQDRTWVFRADGERRFKRVEVQAGAVLPDGSQTILGGLAPGDEVILDALQFANAATRS